MGCGKYEIDRLVPLDDVCRIVWTRVWLDIFFRVDEKRKVALLLEKVVEGICNSVRGYGEVCSVPIGQMAAEKEAIVV